MWTATVVVGAMLICWVALITISRLVARPAKIKITLDAHNGTELVVLVHGLAGRTSFEPLIELTRRAIPHADLLVIAYDARPVSNEDVFAVTNQLEAGIHETFEARGYQSIVLVGHSMGAMVARKALIWGHGIEDDRRGPKGKRRWVDRVTRFISLAGINRGWSIEPAPENMTTARYVGFRIGEVAARITGVGKLGLALQRGAPFIADSRVQWIRLTRDAVEGEPRRLPQAIHFLGDRDDIVSRADAADLGVAKDTRFVTMPNTTHRDIIAFEDPHREAAIRASLVGDLDRLSFDMEQKLVEDLDVERIVYIMHGIRDYGSWTDRVRQAIVELVRSRPEGAASIAIVNKKYGYFAMLPFLLYWDRQRNVRRFMDEYTENVARYPRARRFDFVGHSNGTYILASALQHYKSSSVGRVYFAGSVVPKHYPWRHLLDSGRVERVVNVLAAGDWVVALFPKLFEQTADWLKVQPISGVLDIGAGGFRGFEAADDPLGRLHNISYVKGRHSAGVDVTNTSKLDAIVSFIVDGQEEALDVFRNRRHPSRWLDVLSNVSWIVWALLASGIVYGGLLAFTFNPIVGLVYIAVIYLLLISI